MIKNSHKYTLHTDILFGLMKNNVRFGSDLELIVSSDMSGTKKISKYFDDVAIFMIPVSIEVPILID